MGIASNMRHLREVNNLTQSELADKVGVTQKSISYFESGFKKPSLELAKRIADVLGTTVDELLK